MTALAHDPDKGLSVQCSRCTVAALDDPDFDRRGSTHQDRIAYLLQLAVRRGWKVEADGPEASVVCPACQLADEAPPPPPPYCWRSKCPKCKFGRVGTRFDSGKTATALHPREHLIRTCGRCGFGWPQATVDATTQETETMNADQTKGRDHILRPDQGSIPPVAG